MNNSHLLGFRSLDGAAVLLTVCDGFVAERIEKRSIPAEYEVLDGLIVPGLIDIHVHGALSNDFATATPAQIRRIIEYHAARGTTGLMATVATSAPWDTLERLRLLAPFVDAGDLIGIHLEGPFLAPERRGAHCPSLLRTPSQHEVEAILETAAGRLTMITIAPEIDGAESAIRQFVEADTIVAVGHTTATFGQARAAFDAGASVVTHLFNGMRPMHHREGGLVAAALLDERVTIELIVDGHHLADETVEIVRRLAPGRLALVSDSMAATGSPDGTYEIAGSPVIVQDGVALLADGSSLAGSTTTLGAALTRVLTINGFSADEATSVTSGAARRLLGLPAPLSVGTAADLVVVNPSTGAVQQTMKGGRWCPLSS